MRHSNHLHLRETLLLEPDLFVPGHVTDQLPIKVSWKTVHWVMFSVPLTSPELHEKVKYLTFRGLRIIAFCFSLHFTAHNLSFAVKLVLNSPVEFPTSRLEAQGGEERTLLPVSSF